MSSRNSSTSEVFKGISFLSGEQIARISLGLLANIIIARALGPGDLGRLSLVLSFGVILSHFSVMGAHEPTIKRLIESPGQHNLIMGTSLAVRLFGSLIGIIITSIVLLNIDAYSDEVKVFIFLLSFFQTFKVLDCIYDFLLSKIKVQAVAAYRTITTISLTLSKIIIVYLFNDWRLLIAITLLELVLSSVIYIFQYKKEKLKTTEWRFNQSLFIELLKESLPIFLLTISVFTILRVDQIMISQMLTFEDNGQYAISSRVIESLLFLPITITCVFYPSILQKGKGERENELKIMYGILFLLALIQSLFFSFLGPYIIPVVFGEKFQPAVNPFIINCWSCIFIYWNLGRLKSAPIMSSVYQHMIFMVFLLFTNILLNSLLIPQMGIVGAAIASVLAPILIVAISALVSPVLRRDAYLFISSPKNTIFFLYAILKRKAVSSEKNT